LPHSLSNTGLLFKGVMGGSSASDPEGWLIDPDKHWSLRFHRDQKSWSMDPFVFMDKGRAMKDGSPALLKSRRHLHKRDAVEIWRKLRADGWSRVKPQWGLGLDP